MIMKVKANMDEVINIESDLLRSIDYRLNIDSEEEFLKIYALLLKLSDRDKMICHYLLEVGLLNPLLVRELPSKKAIAVVYLLYHLVYMESPKECPLKSFVGYSVKEIRPVAKEYLKALIFSKENDLVGSRRKY